MARDPKPSSLRCASILVLLILVLLTSLASLGSSPKESSTQSLPLSTNARAASAPGSSDALAAQAPERPAGSLQPASTVRGLSLPPSPATTGPILPYGSQILSAEIAPAASVPSLNLTSSQDCATPSSNSTSSNALTLKPNSTGLLCLNGISGGEIDSAWQSNLTNYTTYRNGTSDLLGCPPILNQTSCAFYASNRYTGNVSQWVNDAPQNSSEIWAPGETGYGPSDSVFCLLLAFNNSYGPGTTYTVSINLANATPVPVTFYVRTTSLPDSGLSDVALVFDMTAAWLTLLPQSGGNHTLVPSTAVTVGGYQLAVAAYQCAICLVKFVETGLPAGTSWWVLGDAAEHPSTTDMTWLALTNGSYGAIATSQNSNYTAPYLEFTVSGTSETIAVTFGYSYTVTLVETGLPISMSWFWSVYSDALRISSGVSGLPEAALLVEPNGTYTFTAGTTYGRYAAEPGSFVVSGGSLNVTVGFRPVTFPIQFDEEGLPAGTNWSVEVNGSTYYSVAHELTIPEVNGTYRYYVSSVSGYQPSSSNGNLTVSGNPVPVVLTYSAIPGSSFFPSLFGSGLLLGGLIALAGAIGGIGAYLWRRRKQGGGIPPIQPPNP